MTSKRARKKTSRGKPARIATAEPKAVVAIEFGIRRSGWAFSLRGKAEGGIFVRVPEGNHQGEKTETAVLLSSETCDVLSFGSSARERYIENRNSGRLFVDFMNDFPSSLAKAECGQMVSLRALMAAVLGHFKMTALKYLSSTSEVPLVARDVAWVIAVPAIFDTVARRFVRDAAQQGGIIDTIDSPQLKLFSQLNAAYLAAYDQKSQDFERDVGTKTMILDCGASTVDIATHEVVSLNPVSLKELVPPMTGAWGSIRVDNAFSEWFKDFIGEDTYSRVRLGETFFDLMRRWEECKTKFDGKLKDRIKCNMADIAAELSLDVQMIQDLRTAHNKSQISSMHVKGKGFIVILPSLLVKSFFTPTLGMIRCCLGDMKSSFQRAGVSLDYVFLVGGFSSSPLVQAAVRQELDDGGCIVKATFRPDVAVVKGAVIATSSPTVFDPPPSDVLSVMLSQERKNHDETKSLLSRLRQEFSAAQEKKIANKLREGQADEDGKKGRVQDASDEKDQTAKCRQLRAALLKERERLKEVNRHKADAAQLSNERDMIVQDHQRLNVLLQKESEEQGKTQARGDKYQAIVAARNISTERPRGSLEPSLLPISDREIQDEIKQTLTVWVSEWAEEMCDLLGARAMVLHHLLVKVFLESQALVERRRLEVYSFFLCGSNTPKTAIDMDQDTADFMLKHMRLHFEHIFPLKGVCLEKACDTIVKCVAEWMSHTLDCVTWDEAATLLEGPSPSLRRVIDKYLHVLVWANLQYPRMEFKDDCGQEQAFNPWVHAPSIDGANVRPGDKCVVIFPASKAETSDKAYILPMDLES